MKFVHLSIYLFVHSSLLLAEIENITRRLYSTRQFHISSACHLIDRGINAALDLSTAYWSWIAYTKRRPSGENELRLSMQGLQHRVVHPFSANISLEESRSASVPRPIQPPFYGPVMEKPIVSHSRRMSVEERINQLILSNKIQIKMYINSRLWTLRVSET